MNKRLISTFLDMVALDSISKQEDQVAEYIMSRLTKLKIKFTQDKIGNVIALVSGSGESILLNAHMDRVPPGKGNKPRIKGDVIKSDGMTNLGADDAVGIAVILESIERIIEQKLPHPSLVLAFTVQEEIGLWGAKALDVSKFQVKQGIVIDNAFAAGVVVSRGAAYIALDVEIQGEEKHPGKDLTQGVNALKVFLESHLPLGEVDRGMTRVNIGELHTGRARNIVPGNLTFLGEVRSFLSEEKLIKRVDSLKKLLLTSAKRNRAKIIFTTNQLAKSYEVDLQEKLLKKYKQVVESQRRKFVMQDTFVASDANALRAEKGLKTFVISTGVENEHTVSERVKMSDIENLTALIVATLTQN